MKIYDVFMFFQEWELLELRLNELRSVVDEFVILEANRTFSGKPKDYVLLDHLFSKYGDWPINYVPYDLSFLDDNTDPWIREFTQRRALKEALDPYKLADDDIILMGDLDEIPDSSFIDGREGRFYQKCYYFYLNWRTWPYRYGTTMYTARVMREQDYEDFRTADSPPFLFDVGWHFSSVGTDADVTRKMEAYSHYLETPAHEVLRRRHAGVDIMDRDPSIETVGGSHPIYLQKNISRFRHLIWPPLSLVSS